MVKYKSNRYVRNNVKIACTDQKKLWKCINNLTKPSCDTNTNCDIILEDISVINESTADKFNNYFIDSLEEIVSSIPVVNYNQTSVKIPALTSIFKLVPINVYELENILSRFKNKANRDDLITTSVLKDAFCIVGYFFVQIINVHVW